MNLTARAGAGLALTLVVPPPPLFVSSGGHGLLSLPSQTTKITRPSPKTLTSRTWQCRSYWSALFIFLGSFCKMCETGTAIGIEKGQSGP